jgi:tripartite-type tricarboxylate transporter receptor subunit TctC
LAVTTSVRSDALPDVPTVGEFVPGYEASALLSVIVYERLGALPADDQS